MIVPEKSKIALKQKTYVKSYRRFALRQLLDGKENPSLPEKDGALLATKAKNCFFDDGLEASVCATQIPYGELINDNSIIVNKFFSYGEHGKEWLGFMKKFGETYLYDETEKKYVIKCSWRIVVLDIVYFYDETGYKRVAFITSDGVTIFDGVTFVKAYNQQTGGRGCYAGERLFFLGKKDRVYYSAPLNAYEFSDSADESGYLDLYSTDGNIVDIKDFGENVFVFRSGGVGKITAKGSASDFRYEEIPYTGGKILARSAVKANDGVYFVATDGVYICDGKGTKKLETNTPMVFKNNISINNSVFFEGKLFLEFLDSFGSEKRYFCLNTQTGVGDYVAYLEGLSVAMGGLISHLDGQFKQVTVDTYDSRTVGNTFGDEKYFTVEETDFEIDGEKTVESIYLSGKGRCDITLSSGEDERTETVDLSEGEEILFRIKGERFTLTLTLENGAKIRLLQMKIKGL